MIGYIGFLAEGSQQVSQGKLNEEQWVRSLSHYSAGRRAAINDLNISGVKDLHKHWDIIHSRGLEHMLRNGRSTAKQMAESDPKLKKAVDDLGVEAAQQVLDDTHSAAKTYVEWLHNRGEHFDGNVSAMGADVSGEQAGALMGRKGGKRDKSDVVALAHDVRDHPDIFLKKQGFKTSKINDDTRDIFQLALEHTENAADHSDKINSILDNHGIDAEKREDIVNKISNYQKKAVQRYAGISAKYSSTGSKDIKVSQITTRDILNAAKAGKKSEAYKTLEDSKGFSDEIRQLIYDHPIVGPMVRAVHGPNPKKMPQDAFKMARRANDFLVKKQKPSPSLLAYAEKITDATNLKLGDVIKALSDAHEDIRNKQQEHIGRITDAMHDSVEAALKDTNKRWAFIRGLAGQTPTRQEGGAVTNLVSVISKGKGKQPDTKVITLQRALDALQREHQKGGRYKGHDWWLDRSGMSVKIKHGFKNDPKTHRTVYNISGDAGKAITEEGTGSQMAISIPSNSPIMDRNILLEKTDEPIETHIAHPDEAGSNQHGGSNFHSKDELKPVNENTQLNEATTDTKQGKQTHLEHVEDLAYDGHDGVGLADQHLRQMHNYLIGARRNTPDRVETKVDGAPAFHIFKDNEGRIGVGTKSMFNKNPKLNFTEEDIDANHGHAPGLAAVLKQVLTHAHKMVPSDMKPGEIYKGDFLFGDGSSGRGRETTDEFHEFQPNTLRYKVPLDSPEGAKVGNAKVGIALHTYFGTDGVAGPIDRKRRAKLLDHPDVYNYDPTVNVNPVNYTPMEQRQFEEHMENARKAYSKIKPEVYDQLVGHDQHMRTYTNQRVRAGAEGPGNVDEYLDFLNQRAQKDINSVKTQAAKDRKTKQHAALMQQVVQNAKHVQNIFDMHNHLQNAKNVLIGVSGKNSNEAVELPDGSPTGHEGYVSTIKTGDGGQHQGKFVRRDEFSLANFAQGSFQKPVQESLEEGIVDRLKGMFKSFRGNKSQNHHLVWGRMNPIHAGHEMVMKAAAEAANRDNGNVSLVLTGTQDKTKNPLSAEQKLKHARRAFPGIDVSVADKSNPTILHQAAKLYNNGVKNLTVHVGSDRVEQFSKLLNDYNGVNGKGHGYYQFHNINVVPVGDERDEDAGGVAGASATNMRKAAENNDRETFHSMAPSTMKPEDVDEMMADVQAGMTRKEELSAYFINRFKTLRG